MYIFISLAFLFVIVTFMMALSNQTPDSRSGIYDNSDSLAAAKQLNVAAVMESIRGKEKLPADSVFKDVQMLKGMPAENLLGIMNKGFATAMGVG